MASYAPGMEDVVISQFLSGYLLDWFPVGSHVYFYPLNSLADTWG